MASSSASLLKASPVKSDWVKGQSLLIRQPSSVAAIRSNAAPSALTVRAASYADELVKTAVIIISEIIFSKYFFYPFVQLLIWLVAENNRVSGTRNIGDGRVKRDLREAFGVDWAREHGG